MSKRVLVIAAHPDDEVLGCGATIAKHASNEHDVSIVFMADGVSSRQNNATENELKNRNEHAIKAGKILGLNPPIFLGFPDNKMDAVALLDVVQKLEKIIDEIKPSIIYTHHPGDLNIDHKITFQAVMTACRPQPDFCVREIYSFEILSSTEWAAPSNKTAFIPNCFVDVSNTIETKISALRAYEDEIRKYPHSRSVEAVRALARYRGASVGMSDAEAFTVQRILTE